MGVRNYLIEGVTCSGKTSVCRELQRRGYQAFNGDTDLAYQGDPETGEPADGSSPGHHIWHVGRVEALVANQDEAVTFFCGGSRNFSKFVTLFDGVFVLEVDLDTLHRRLDSRVDEWGSKPAEREIVVRLHQTKEQIPSNGIVIDATAPLEQVVDEIVLQSEAAHRHGNAAERPDQRAEPRMGPGPGAV
jgi:broad-specificity NMP kinase